MTNNHWNIIEREILPFVEKPARYTGGELNSVVKDRAGRTSVALIYPDIYEVGISNIGLKILYDILNKQKEFVCERAYAPWTDMEKEMREKNVPLYGLESKTPLGDFDILGFSFQYELLYTNFLNMLDLSGIPFYSADRNENHPFIIAGGPAAVNPEPVARFLDAVAVGDGEQVILDIARAVRNGKKQNKIRKDVLQDLSAIEGVYVPSLHREEEKNGYIVPAGTSGNKIKRAFFPDLEKCDFVTKQIIPNIQAVQDRAVVEAARGCTRGCRFCQAGMTYRPVRERSAASILKIAREAIKNTGYHEFSLISLSISDHSQLSAMIETLDEQFSPHGMSFSLPSLRLDSFTLDLAKKVREIRKSGLTFAVEGGTAVIREAINKGVKEEELMNVIGIAKGEGWKNVKLYFMIGLPHTNAQEEIKGIAELCEKIAMRYRDMSMTVSVAVFIPKPHTPYQWSAQLGPDEGLARFHELIQLLKRNRKINIRYNNPHLSYLEGIFSRGDRKLAGAIESAFRKGARFDGWNEKADLKLWNEAFKDAGVDPSFYLKEKSLDTVLPWEIIDAGADREYLLKELDKSAKGLPTGDCGNSRNACANGCGNCDFEEVKPLLQKNIRSAKPKVDRGFMKNIRMDTDPKYLMRFIFTKTGAMKFINPIDLEELLSRALIRANTPVVFTKGFNPHIRVEMGWAIPVGFSSLYEPAEVELSKKVSGKKFIRLLNRTLPEGVRIQKAACFKMPRPKLARAGKAQLVSFSIDAVVPPKTVTENLKNASNFKKITSKNEKSLDLNEYIKDLSFRGKKILITYFQTEGGARIQDVIGGMTGFDVRQAVQLDPLIHNRSAQKDGKEIELFEL